MTKWLDTTGRGWHLSAAIAIALIAGMTMPVVAGDLPPGAEGAAGDKEAGLLAKEGRPVRIMPLGDSITYDNRRGDTRPTGDRISYRFTLHELLSSEGYAFDFVGSSV